MATFTTQITPVCAGNRNYQQRCRSTAKVTQRCLNNTNKFPQNSNTQRLKFYASSSSYMTGDSGFSRHVNFRHTASRPLLSSRQSSLKIVSQGRLVTCLGKGGAGKTTAAITLAKHYAESGKKVLLITQSEDLSAEDLLGLQLPTAAIPEPVCVGQFDAARVYATKLLEEPWKALKSAEQQFAFAGGILAEMTVEELPMVPGLDMFAVLSVLRRFTLQYDVVVYDGPSSPEVLRLLATPSKLQWYLERIQKALSRSDAGRIILPTLLSVMESMLQAEAMAVEGSEVSIAAGGSSWERLKELLSKAALAFQDSKSLSAFLVVNSGAKASSTAAAMRLWAGAMQADIHVGGVVVCDDDGAELDLSDFSPLPVLRLPPLQDTDFTPLVGVVPSDWEDQTSAPSLPAAVTLDTTPDTCTVRFFLPGLEKSEVRLTQRLSNQEILVDACGQRQIVQLPQGFKKVTGAKFEDRYLNVTLTSSA